MNVFVLLCVAFVLCDYQVVVVVFAIVVVIGRLVLLKVWR